MSISSYLKQDLSEVCLRVCVLNLNMGKTQCLELLFNSPIFTSTENGLFKTGNFRSVCRKINIYGHLCQVEIFGKKDDTYKWLFTTSNRPLLDLQGIYCLKMEDTIIQKNSPTSSINVDLYQKISIHACRDVVAPRIA